MAKYPKSHWPPPEPPEFPLDGWLSVFEAFNLVGRDRFPDELLDGKELAAPSDEEFEANREAAAKKEFQATIRERNRRIKKANRASRRVVSGSDLPQVRTARPKRSAAPYKGQPFTADVVADEGVRKAARERGDKVWNELRQWFFDGTVGTKCFDDQGRDHEIIRNDWGRWNARSMLFTGRATMNGRSSDVLISQADLEAAIRGEPRPDQAAAQDESTLGDEAIEPIATPRAKTSEKAATPGSGKSNSKPSKPGRPSKRADIIKAYDDLYEAGEIDFKSKAVNYPAIREKLTGSRHTIARGLGDDAIRKAMGPHFDDDKAEADKAKGSKTTPQNPL